MAAKSTPFVPTRVEALRRIGARLQRVGVVFVVPAVAVMVVFPLVPDAGTRANWVGGVMEVVGGSIALWDLLRKSAIVGVSPLAGVAGFFRDMWWVIYGPPKLNWRTSDFEIHRSPSVEGVPDIVQVPTNLSIEQRLAHLEETISTLHGYLVKLRPSIHRALGVLDNDVRIEQDARERLGRTMQDLLKRIVLEGRDLQISGLLLVLLGIVVSNFPWSAAWCYFARLL